MNSWLTHDHIVKEATVKLGARVSLGEAVLIVLVKVHPHVESESILSRNLFKIGKIDKELRDQSWFVVSNQFLTNSVLEIEVVLYAKDTGEGVLTKDNLVEVIANGQVWRLPNFVDKSVGVNCGADPNTSFFQAVCNIA